MAAEPKLVAQRRVKLGTTECRRLRRQGIVPGNVYGHDTDPVALTVSEEVLSPLVSAGARVVDLEIDGTTEKAILRDIQWDTFGKQIQHFDLMRVDPNERVTVEVPVEVRGIAPGVTAGGVLEQPVRSLTIECSAIKVPDRITVRVSDLEIGDTIHVGDLDLSDIGTCTSPDDLLIVQVIKLEERAPTEEEAPAEPELIRRREEEGQTE